MRTPTWRRPSASNARWSARGPNASWPRVWRAWRTLHVVRLACEHPELLGRSLSPWAGPALARQLLADGIVEDLSAATGRRMLAAHQLKPWRQHRWRHPQHPRDASFSATVAELMARSTRPLQADELVLSRDEKTSLQPRPRPSPTRPARPHHRPNRLETAT
jgi:hypothetical protein